MRTLGKAVERNARDGRRVTEVEVNSSPIERTLLRRNDSALFPPTASRGFASLGLLTWDLGRDRLVRGRRARAFEHHDAQRFARIFDKSFVGKMPK
jgi:hypothetical protein